MIDSIGLKNITVFNDVELAFSKGINIIVGENGTGKTHILKLLYASATDNGGNLRQIFETPPVKNFNLVYDTGIFDEFKIGTTGGDVVIKIDPFYKQYTFIPAKEMLSHSKGLIAMSEKYSRDMPFDKTLLDILKMAQVWKPDIIPELAQNIAPRLEKIIDGTVFMKSDNSFWIRKHGGLEIPFSMEAEGLRKFGLLWQLLMNEGITKDTILFWDEPEANLNPQLVPVLVEILLELSQSGVQIFIATHCYDLAKYIDVKKQQSDNVLFHSLYKTNNGVQCETSLGYQSLQHNAIEQAATELYNSIIAHDIEVLENE